MNRWMIGLLALWPGLALGQTGFFDHFEGNALLPHWNQPPASHWEYNVSNSMLNVTRLLYPSHPQSPYNNASIGANFTPIAGDFYARVRMGWEAGSFPLTAFLLTATTGHGIVEFGYAEPNVYVKTGLIAAIRFPAPPPGMHDFVVQRIGGEVHFSLNGNPLITLPDSGGAPTWVTLSFLGPYPDPGLRPLHVDLVQVVPSPAGAAVFVAFALSMLTRRRR